MATKFPKISEINTTGIVVKKGSSDNILPMNLYYNNNFLRCQTGLIECKGGVSEDGKIRFKLSNAASVKIREIDTMVADLAEEQGIDHHPIAPLDEDDDLSLSLSVGSWTKFFDNNKAPIDNNSSMLSTEFTALILLDMSRLVVFNDRFMLSITVQQVMVRTYSQLPRGCVIYKSLGELRPVLQKAPSETETAMEAFQSLGPYGEDINELLQ